MTFLLIDCCRQLDLTFIKNSITESSSPGEIAKKTIWSLTIAKR